MKWQLTTTSILLMLITNLLCSSEVRAQIIKGVEETRPMRPRRVIVPPKVKVEPESAELEPASAAVLPVTEPVVQKAAEKPAEEKKSPAQNKDKLDHKVDYFVRAMIRNTTYGSSIMSGNNPAASIKETMPNKDTVYNDFRARRLFFGINGKIDNVWIYCLVINATQLIGNGTAVAENGVVTVGSGIQEASIGWAPSSAFVFRVGSMKTPFARENLTSSVNLLLVERALGVSAIGRLFDTGAQIQGKFVDGRISYGMGIFNGNGGFANGVNSDPAGVSLASGRLQLDPLGEYKNGEAQFSNKFLLSLGVAGAYEKNRNGPNIGSPLPVTVTNDLVSATADIGFNWGRLSLEVAYLTAYSPANSLKFGSVQGYYGTLGFWLIGQTLQIVGRYESYLNATAAVPTSTVTVTNAANTVVEQKVAAAEDIREKRYVALGFNILFLEKAKLKLQAFYHYGLNRYYTTQNDAHAIGGATKITNASQDFGHADDWFIVQLQMSL